ncbi:CRTAC1 family protein [Algoriphagus boritolerans]|uniref:CRTAC1 family protein n=1 Tax=Algoriphagus boritolerans TaxID=308111 RepID=UPI000AF7CB73
MVFFSDVAPIMGVSATDWSWSPLFADLNNDGYKDLYITNGIYRRPNDLDYLNYTSNNAVRSIIDLKDSLMSQRLIALMPQLKISNKAYINKNGEYFEDITNNWGLKIPSYSNGAAYSDLDNDGDLELIVNNINESAFLFENKINEKQPDQTYLKIALKGKDFNSMGIGTKVIIKNKGKTYYQEQYPVRGFLSSVSQILHFGLGTLKQVDSLWVIWPRGSYQFLDNVDTGQILTVDEGDASGDYYSKTIHIEENKRFFSLSRYRSFSI